MLPVAVKFRPVHKFTDFLRVWQNEAHVFL